MLVNVHLPKDRISMAHQGYGFCEFLTEEDAEYACKIMNQIKLWGKPIRVNKVRIWLLYVFKALIGCGTSSRFRSTSLPKHFAPVSQWHVTNTLSVFCSGII